MTNLPAQLRPPVLLALLMALFQPAGAQDLYDLILDNDTSATLNALELNTPQVHELSGPGDEDWFVLPGRVGAPHSIEATPGAADLDLEITLLPDAPGFYPGPIDFELAGVAERYSIVNWPAGERYVARVRAVAPFDAPATYSLVFRLDAGANLGLATISGTTIAKAVPAASRITLPPAYEGQPRAYTKTALAYTSGTFAGAADTGLELAGLGYPSHLLTDPPIARWLQLHPGNLSLTRVRLLSSGETPAAPLTLTLQLRGDIWEPGADIEDSRGNLLIAERLRDFNPLATLAMSFQVARWSEELQEWDHFLTTSDVTHDGQDILVDVEIPAVEFEPGRTLFYAANQWLPFANARTWTLFE